MTSVTDRNSENVALLRAAMVGALRDMGAITSDRVAAAFGAVPRDVFAPDEPLEAVYDANLPLVTKRAEDGTAISSLSAAHIQAVMLEQAEIAPGMRVLEVGTGGFNAALIAELVGAEGSVTTVDIDEEIVARARVGLQNAGYDQVRVVHADAEHGVQGEENFDAIIVTVGAYDLPPAWLDQLTADGRIVVPLRFAGLTRCIAFDRTTAGLVSHSYRLGGFVPMQGDGAFTEHLVPINGEVTLRVDDQSAEFDVPALRKAVHSPRIERWSGAAFDLPDELELFLVTSAPLVPLLYASESLVTQGVFAASVTRGVPVLVDGGSFAYRTKRPNELTGGFESGVFAHGPDAEVVAERYLEQLQRWARGFRRRGAARIEYLPNSVGAQHLTGWHTTKRHGTVAVSWS